MLNAFCILCCAQEHHQHAAETKALKGVEEVLAGVQVRVKPWGFVGGCKVEGGWTE